MLPQYPYWLQQLPKPELVQLKPAVPAHDPSVETLTAAVGVALAEVAATDALADEAGADPVQEPKPDWQPAPQ